MTLKQFAARAFLVTLAAVFVGATWAVEAIVFSVPWWQPPLVMLFTLLGVFALIRTVSWAIHNC